MDQHIQLTQQSCGMEEGNARDSTVPLISFITADNRVVCLGVFRMLQPSSRVPIAVSTADNNPRRDFGGFVTQDDNDILTATTLGLIPRFGAEWIPLLRQYNTA